MAPVFTVRSRSFDGKVKRMWTAELVEHAPELLLLKGVFETPVSHSDLGEIAAGTISYEYFWPERWYNIFRFLHPDGTFRCFYCNISLPPVIAAGTVDYIDLDIDAVIDPAGGFRVLDEAEFIENSQRFGYPRDLIETVPDVLDSLRTMAAKRQFPFDLLQPNAR